MVEDKILLWRFRQGSCDALRGIYDKYKRSLFSLANNLLRDSSLAEDVVQEVFISFVKSAETVKLTSSLKNYLITCTVNKSRDIIRKKIRQQVNLQSKDEIQLNTDGPVQLAMRTEQLEHLQSAMTELSDDQRETILLRLHGGLKFREIAKVQNSSTKTVQSRYRNGLQKLRSLMNSEL